MTPPATDNTSVRARPVERFRSAADLFDAIDVEVLLPTAFDYRHRPFILSALVMSFQHIAIAYQRQSH
jgi:hypothetical protein